MLYVRKDNINKKILDLDLFFVANYEDKIIKLKIKRAY